MFDDLKIFADARRAYYLSLRNIEDTLDRARRELFAALPNLARVTWHHEYDGGHQGVEVTAPRFEFGDPDCWYDAATNSADGPTEDFPPFDVVETCEAFARVLRELPEVSLHAYGPPDQTIVWTRDGVTFR